MNKYDINYKKLVVMLTPIVLRLPFILTFLHLLVSPIQRLARIFGNYRSTTNYRLSHNGQVCYLTALLNDYFDVEERRIKIEDIPQKMPSIIYKRAKSIFLKIPNAPRRYILNRRGFGGIDSFDFMIQIPIALQKTIDINRLIAIVGKYKLASKRFTITYY